MQNRRDFLKNIGLTTGASGLMLSQSIQRAFAIDPAPGTTFMDAEHVVILMQENRSFDHIYGTLRGVRGFDDPRAIQLPDGNPVWLQTNRQGQTFAPFRLDLAQTKATWLGSLPHSWTDQTDARNHGKYDKWLDAKRSSHQECVGMPFTLGTYTRKDLPFYYDLADAFTVCDQHFCSSLTGTMANRLYLWSGTIRGVKDASAPARLNNNDSEYEDACAWKTFPDRLEEWGISWKVYQNEISAVDVGFKGEEYAWLSNFGDNPLEWFRQYHVGFSPSHRARLQHLISSLPAEIDALQKQVSAQPDSLDLKKKLAKTEAALLNARERFAKFSPENFAKLSQHEKNLFTKGLSTNVNDPNYRQLTTLRYQDGATERKLQVPKGDVLHQFRSDVNQGKLPTVSWIVAPENFSDHPGAAWYGAWYLSEVMNILTRNPEVWRKTIFLLTYDENDGYYDHVPPFVAPDPRKPETGITTPGVRTDEEFVTLEEELKTKPERSARESSIGLGYRVPLVVASPWSRGGYVCSQVFDHTSSLQFLEKFLSKKLNKTVAEPNISEWRRTVCGDLTSSFRPYHGEKIPLPPFLNKDPFLQSIHQAQFKPVPTGFKALSADEIAQAKSNSAANPHRITQESGTRPACPLPYELAADGAMNAANQAFEINFSAKKDLFGGKAAGGAFTVYAPHGHKAEKKKDAFERCRSWNFAVTPGQSLKYSWPLQAFEDQKAFLRVYGPNGFFREFRSDQRPQVQIQFRHHAPTGILLAITNTSDSPCDLAIIDNAYGAEPRHVKIPGLEERFLPIDLAASSGWHDLSIRPTDNSSFEFRFAGRIENGLESISDPLIGRS